MQSIKLKFDLAPKLNRSWTNGQSRT